jgi:hypothetical protein
MVKCVNHVGAHRVKSAAERSRTKFVQAAGNRQKNALVSHAENNLIFLGGGERP